MVKKLFQDDRLVIFDGATGTSCELGWSAVSPLMYATWLSRNWWNTLTNRTQMQVPT